MIISKNTLSELRYYLSAFEEIVDELPLEKQVYREGTTVGQILFHTFQVVNYWFRVILLEGTYIRNRAEEFTKQPTLHEIKKSLQFAQEVSKILEKKRVQLDRKIKTKNVVEPANFAIETANDLLMHITTHTAEHWGELHLVKK